MSVEIVLATHNQHKVEEFQRLVSRDVPGITVLGYDGPEPVEDGTSFSENALIKARVAAAHTGSIALADDSGIGVDILGGAPGIFSARWAGSHHDSSANLALLLDQLRDVRAEHRSAWFACHLALVVPAGIPGTDPFEHVAVGTWRGALATEPIGTNGFGYDPAFIPSGDHRTAAQLTPVEKNESSHRAIAFRELVPVLRGLLPAPAAAN
ncbi:non-canonical purine NTP pyrophosphatase [Plantibacter sp. Leaf314]|uniref:non-canonical purine NTP pyrophosphatase n=1 Tax=Plantibacter sp. Leaf314 TaxID=1736333 RepID=UPI0006F515D4|nr:non-canonical purine NTP pyrophosphatase [Plantibacter sp. Leaf314]KQQ51621.1 non-canonical purine NTP pyrophosphatase [Plantibacter sp. Leaf314]